MYKVVILLLISNCCYAEGMTLPPNKIINSGSWVDGQYVTSTTKVDSTGKRAITSGWITDPDGNKQFETKITTLNADGTKATTSGWHDGEYIVKHSTIQK